MELLDNLLRLRLASLRRQPEFVLEPLLRSGLTIQALTLHGEPRTALTRLGGSAEADRRTLARLDLLVEPLRTSEQVEQQVEFRRRYFTANPQHSPVNVPQPSPAEQAAIDEFVRKKLLRGIGDEPATQFVLIDRRGLVAGGFGLQVRRRDPLYGSSAGVEIALDPRVHGRGLGRTAYRILLARMLDLELRVFRGSTANPAVLHLGRAMGRTLRGWKLVPGAAGFPIPARFEYPRDRE